MTAKGHSENTRAPAEKPFVLRLYISGNTISSGKAIVNLRRFCETHLKDRYDLEVVDIVLHPERAATDQVIALPTLVRSKPLPLRRFIGDLSDTQRLLDGMEVGFEGPGSPSEHEERP